MRGVRVAGGQQLLTVEYRVRSRQEAEGLQLVAHLAAARRQTNMRVRHENAGRGNRPDEVERVQRRGVRQRRAGYPDQQIDGHALGM